MKPLKIEKMTFPGQGLGRVEGKAVFVPGSVPGDLVEPFQQGTGALPPQRARSQNSVFLDLGEAL